MKQKKYYIYAGYYELWISDIKLGCPLTYISSAYSLEDAQAQCEKYDLDAEICYSKSLKSELREQYDHLDDEDFESSFPFFNEQEYKLTA